MAKPRIIIADTDAGYIYPLQLRFAEEFFEKVDLEIITDANYFRNLLSTPQKAEILIVSEELYDRSISRHNISHTFVMDEQYEEEQTGDLNVNHLLKYTSVKEIFNEIVGKSANILKFQDNKSQETQVVLVCSANGGTGKTIVAMGISASLTKNYKRVLYINADRLHSFHYLLENKTPISAADVYAKLTVASESIYSDIKHIVRKELFYYIPPFKAALLSLGLKYSIYEKIILSAKKSGEYDYIIVDADVAFDEDKAGLIGIADKVMVIVNQGMASVIATNVLVSNLNGMNDEKYVFLCNNFNKDRDNALISPIVSLKFTVSDYIDHFSHSDLIKPESLSKESSIQRAAFLVI